MLLKFRIIYITKSIILFANIERFILLLNKLYTIIVFYLSSIFSRMKLYFFDKNDCKKLEAKQVFPFFINNSRFIFIIKLKSLQIFETILEKKFEKILSTNQKK